MSCKATSSAPGGWDSVTGFVKCLLGIPHQALAIEAFPNTAIISLPSAIIRDISIQASNILLLQLLNRNEGADIDHLASGGKACEQTWLWEVGNIRGVATFNTGGDEKLEALVTSVLNVDACGFLKGLDGVVKLHFVLIGKTAQNGYCGTLECTRMA